MGKILPVLLALIGLGGGVGAGIALRPDPQPEQQACEGVTLEAASAEAELPEAGPEEAPKAADYVKLNNQFVVPVIKQDSVRSLVVMALSLEITEGGAEKVYKLEPKLRDAFLQVMFEHANSGGFDGNFTTGNNMNILRRALLEAAQKIMGPSVSDVLIVDVVRQDAA